jgi:hypothetical protein
MKKLVKSSESRMEFPPTQLPSAPGASLVSRIARICPEPANGLPNSLALFWTANLGRFSTTEARTGDTPRSTSAQRSSSRSAIQLRQVRRAISATLENSVVDRRYDRFLLR